MGGLWPSVSPSRRAIAHGLYTCGEDVARGSHRVSISPLYRFPRYSRGPASQCAVYVGRHSSESTNIEVHEACWVSLLPDCSSAQRDASTTQEMLVSERLYQHEPRPSVSENAGGSPREYFASCVVLRVVWDADRMVCRWTGRSVSAGFSNSPSHCVFGAITTIGSGEEMESENGGILESNIFRWTILVSASAWLTGSATTAPGLQSGISVLFPSARACRTRGFSIRSKVPSANFAFVHATQSSLNVRMSTRKPSTRVPSSENGSEVAKVADVSALLRLHMYVPPALSRNP
ncbi:hypothetical protein EDB84DRAFT_1561514 [Lactarius hengduanensis]|nr:hypothetical protein EDB85DRAFT_2159475 [Lactarius pseudohatsudake]KAH9034178.1 hypothetical protein EDB84DRAFT_1561514 [Lactarius hengduanensis]